MRAPVFSILLPVQNDDEKIAETVDSILAQTYADHEILVLNQGSTDRTMAILSTYRDARLRIVQVEAPYTVARTLNQGMAAATGEWIALMDVNCSMHPERLAIQRDYMISNPSCDGVGAWVKKGDSYRNGRRLPLEHDAILAYALFGIPFALATMTFRREIFHRFAMQYDPSFYPAEDYEFWSKIVFAARCANIPKYLCEHRIGERWRRDESWGERDEQMMRAQRNVLQQLGMEASEDELRIHRGASAGKLPPEKASFEKTEAWLQKIRRANQACHVFNAEALDNILGYVWFRLAMGVAPQMGRRAWACYRKGEFAGIGCKRARRRLRVFRAVCLNFFG